MTPATYNVPDQLKGDTFSGLQFTVFNTTTQTPINLTGASIKTEFRTGSATGKVVKTITLGSGITLTDATLGIFTITPFTCDWRAGIYHYDVQITFADGKIKTYITGTIKVTQDVTQ